MGILRVSTNGSPRKGLEDQVSGEGQRLSEEKKSMTNDAAFDVNTNCTFQAQPVPLTKQQRVPGPVVRWERFLPVKTLSILLVENDDSTRHILSALLRNCSYEVTAVAHGLEAWKALEDPSNRIDLVLTEVVTPNLSGIDLLSKILSHKAFRSIPLIMMSSNDSMGIVFKCLSKGAVDFLVKPIRKNELKHLWQHVWRKCHTSGYSRSESGVMIQKPSSCSGNIGHTGNKFGGSAEDENWNTDLNGNNGSDNGSDTQISWSKRVVEVDSQRPIIRYKQLRDPPHTTCAHGVAYSRSEPRTNNWVPGTATWETYEEGDELVAMGKYLEIGIPIDQDLQVKEPNRKMQKTGMGNSKVFDSESKKDEENFEKRVAEVHTEELDVNLSKDYSGSVVVITNSIDPQMEGATSEADPYSKTTKDKTADYITEPLSLELDLNSRREPDSRHKNSDSKQMVLRHSDLSAFSRYGTAINIKQAPTGNVGSCSPPENSARINLQSNTDGTHNQCSNGSSNNDMGSTTDNNIFSKPAAFSDKKLPDAPSSAHLRSAFLSVKNLNDQSILPEIQDKIERPTVQVNSTEQQVQVQHRHHYHHYHHHHHHVHNGQQTQQIPDNNNLSMTNTAESASHFVPSEVLTSPIEGNAANYGLNTSASGSNNGTNGQNDNNIVRTDDGSGNDVDPNNMTRREAALHKFRQKRKNRCFDKKVRYQSRKKLAEERPRVKGHHIKHIYNSSLQHQIIVLHCLSLHHDLTRRSERSSSRSDIVAVNPADAENPGLDPQVLNIFPTFAYSVVKQYRKPKSGRDCAICLLEFQEDHILRLITICTHVFHQKCVDIWFKMHKTCPACRKKLELPADETSLPPDLDGDSVSLTIKDDDHEQKKKKKKSLFRSKSRDTYEDRALMAMYKFS
ncbi:two-component response regulator-like PRR37 [Heracleum sosnowskyi]|uniref:RING-type E3 ubiquitin transferase n=1 Tax=Heracleum sosnowskyi TaxID=360622 RepID=A0AAD8I5C5_9APIA|nr:two-component response regulator-like PRR37 [Heracleum sosnowskyi]